VVQESHVPQDRYTGIPRRIGDAKYQPHASITETGATTEPEQRGHLLLRLANDLKLLIVNGRFETSDSPPPLTTKTTIVDYFLLHSEVFVDVRSCRIHHDTLKTPDSFGIGSDHKLMSLTLALPWDVSNDTKESTHQRGSQRKAPRTRFMTEKLKNAAIQSEFTTELERRSPATRNQLLQLKEQHARLVLPTQTFIDQSHALVVHMIQGVAAKVLSSPNPTHSLGGHPMRTEARERNHQRTLGHNPLLQEIHQQKDSVAELQCCAITGPDDPTKARIEVERLKLHDLKLKLTVAKQMEVDLDITNATKDVSVQIDKDQMQTAWGIWRHYRSSTSTDGCHGLPSRMKTNTPAATDPARWRASEIAKSQSEGAQAWHQYRYAIGHR
jgi:hypothetical protein